MGIVGNGGPDGPAPEPDAGNDAHRHVTVAAVTLHHGDFQQIIDRGEVPVLLRRVQNQLPGDDLPGNDADHREPRMHRQPQPLRRQLRQMHRPLQGKAAAPVGQRKGLPGPADQLSAYIDLVRVHGLHAVQDHQVRQIPRRNGPLMLQPVSLGGIQRRHADGRHRRHPQLNGPTDAGVDVPLPPDVVQMLVVGAENEPVQGNPRLQGPGEDGVQVPGGRPLTDLDVKA